MSTVEQPEEPSVRFCLWEEALKRGRPLPPRERFVVGCAPDDQWTPLQQALAET